MSAYLDPDLMPIQIQDGAYGAANRPPAFNPEHFDSVMGGLGNLFGGLFGEGGVGGFVSSLQPGGQQPGQGIVGSYAPPAYQPPYQPPVPSGPSNADVLGMIERDRQEREQARKNWQFGAAMFAGILAIGGAMFGVARLGAANGDWDDDDFDCGCGI